MSEYSRMLTIGNKQIFKNNTATVDTNNKVNKIDRTWIKSVFMISGADLDPLDAKNRYFTSAETKFTDTTMGGNLGINARPQFCRYTDIRSQGRRMDRTEVTVNKGGNHGMGSYYSEAIDDNSQTLYLEFGVPEFNSLFSFFTRSIDYEMSIIAGTGRSPIWYKAGQIMGNIGMFLMLPVLSVAIWSIKALAGVVLGNSAFKYYYLKPTMHLYWSTVNTIVTTMATELGILIPTFMKENNEPKIGVPMQIDQTDLKEMHELMPDIIGSDNYIDVFAIATRAQAMANKQLELEKKSYESFKDNEAGGVDYIEKISGNISPERNRSFSTWLQDVLPTTGDVYQPKDKKDSTDVPPETNSVTGNDLKPDEEYGTYNTTAEEKDKEGWFSNSAKYFESAAIGGGSHAVFKVDYVGSVSESFSNSITDIPTAGKLKNISKQGRSTHFNFAGGNIAGGTGGVLDAVKDTLAGGLDSMSFGLSNIIPSLFGGAYMDIPKMWEDSSAELPKLNYTMQLISPYGNTISQIQNLYIPLAMIMAGTLPLSTGRSSYTSPFICKAFIKGVHNVQLGMITDLSITRGTSNLAFNKQKRALALDVSFSISDFSQLMMAPVDKGLFGGYNSGMDDESVFGRYIATLASRDLLTDMYAIPKAKMRLSKLKFGLDTSTSPAYWGMRTGSIVRNSPIGVFLVDKSLNLSEKN